MPNNGKLITVILFLTQNCTEALSILMACGSQTTTSTVNNPLTLTDGNPVVMGDPFILHASDGKFYAYGSAEGGLDGFLVYVSDDLSNWSLARLPIRPRQASSRLRFWYDSACRELYQKSLPPHTMTKMLSPVWQVHPGQEAKSHRCPPCHRIANIL